MMQGMYHLDLNEEWKFQVMLEPFHPTVSEWSMPWHYGLMLLVIRIPFHFGLVFTVSLTHRAVHAHGVRADKVLLLFPVKCESVLTKEEFSCFSLCAFIGAMCSQIFQL